MTDVIVKILAVLAALGKAACAATVVLAAIQYLTERKTMNDFIKREDVANAKVPYDEALNDYQRGWNDAVTAAEFIPVADVIPIEWIEAQVDKGKWAELVQRWREANDKR